MTSPFTYQKKKIKFNIFFSYLFPLTYTKWHILFPNNYKIVLLLTFVIIPRKAVAYKIISSTVIETIYKLS